MVPESDFSMLELVTIFTSDNLPEIDIMKSFLESNGIKCFVANEYIVQANWLYSVATGGIQLKIRQEDVAKAKELLSSREELTDVKDKWENPSEQTTNSCPRCGSKNIGNRVGTTKWSFISMLLFFIYFPVFKENWYCFDCGHRWKK